jgi:hypothetical protein
MKADFTTSQPDPQWGNMVRSRPGLSEKPGVAVSELTRFLQSAVISIATMYSSKHAMGTDRTAVLGVPTPVFVDAPGMIPPLVSGPIRWGCDALDDRWSETAPTDPRSS